MHVDTIISFFAGPSEKPGRPTHLDHHPHGDRKGRGRPGPVVQLPRMHTPGRRLRESGILHHRE